MTETYDLAEWTKKVIKRHMKLLNHFFCCRPRSALPSDREGTASNYAKRVKAYKAFVADWKHIVKKEERCCSFIRCVRRTIFLTRTISALSPYTYNNGV